MMQLALNLMQVCDVSLKTYVGGKTGFVASSSQMMTVTQTIAVLPLSICYHGLDYWWIGMQDGPERREERGRTPKHKRWVEDVRSQQKYGWNWMQLYRSLSIAFGWMHFWFMLEAFGSDPTRPLSGWDTVPCCPDNAASPSCYTA